MPTLRELAGFWTGLIVTQTDKVLANVQLEYQNRRLSGRFEFPQLNGKNSKGTVTASMRGDQITFKTPNVGTLRAKLHVASRGPMMALGVVVSDRYGMASVTLFQAETVHVGGGYDPLGFVEPDA